MIVNIVDFEDHVCKPYIGPNDIHVGVACFDRSGDRAIDAFMGDKDATPKSMLMT
jgi:poly-D-alanine transfer protein DltD